MQLCISSAATVKVIAIRGPFTSVSMDAPGAVAGPRYSIQTHLQRPNRVAMSSVGQIVHQPNEVVPLANPEAPPDLPHSAL
jgi:sRNA-binding carbon storage regulator CsrA